MRGIWLQPNSPVAQQAEAELSSAISKETRALDMLSRPEVSYAALTGLEGVGPAVVDPKVAEQLEIQAKYAAISSASSRRSTVNARRRR